MNAYDSAYRIAALKRRSRASLSFYSRARSGRTLGLYLPRRAVLVKGSPMSAAKVRTLAGLGLNTQTRGAASGAQQGAAVGTAVLPGIGTAIGAVVGAVYGWVGGKQPSHAEQTWDSYKGYAGSGQLVAMADTDEAEVWKGAYDTNNAFFNVKGVKSRAQYMQWLVTLLQQSLSDGRITPASTAAQIVDTLVYPAMKAAGSKLNDSPIMHGFLADVVNRLFAGLPMHNERTNNIPSQPITLSVPASFAQPSTAQTAPPATLPPVTLPANAGQAPLIVPPAPAIPSSLAPNGVTPLIPQKSAADATELIQSMLAQNASQADAYNAAIAKLSQSGVAVTPQVQQAVAGEVQAQSTNTVPWLIGGLGVFALLVLSGRSRRHR